MAVNFSYVLAGIGVGGAVERHQYFIQHFTFRPHQVAVVKVVVPRVILPGPGRDKEALHQSERFGPAQTYDADSSLSQRSADSGDGILGQCDNWTPLRLVRRSFNL